MQPRHNSAANRARLAALDRLASAGDEQAGGEARRLRAWMVERDRADEKRQDDRMKVLVGAAVLHQLATGRTVELQEPRDLLELMHLWLERPSEREAVLGADMRGSAALRRTLGLPPPEN